MRESAVERHDRLLSLVRERGTARVSDLAAQLGVSPVTARRDVEALAARGLLDRVHGQVSWPAGQGGGERSPAGGAAAEAPGSGPVLGLLAPSAAYYFAEVIRGAREAAARAGARAGPAHLRLPAGGRPGARRGPARGGRAGAAGGAGLAGPGRPGPVRRLDRRASGAGRARSFRSPAVSRTPHPSGRWGCA
ncbi:DeoR family transcriptional regulator [Streptomyces lavendofoliae]|uniref:Lactose phosphotransferase system repressor n=1 Tax=Streptomyces lavendofoliae TaxID=67314 RepID=A0A918HVV4_9ACTN|nr:hypothetical protein GCM10010274_23120 [Streptomyces lavendofoliae]